MYFNRLQRSAQNENFPPAFDAYFTLYLDEKDIQ